MTISPSDYLYKWQSTSNNLNLYKSQSSQVTISTSDKRWSIKVIIKTITAITKQCCYNLVDFYKDVKKSVHCKRALKTEYLLKV